MAVVGRCAGLLTLEQTGCLLQDVLGLENKSRHAGDGQGGTDKVANGNHCAGDCLTKTNGFWNSEMWVAAGLIVGKKGPVEQLQSPQSRLRAEGFYPARLQCSRGNGPFTCSAARRPGIKACELDFCVPSGRSQNGPLDRTCLSGTHRAHLAWHQ